MTFAERIARSIVSQPRRWWFFLVVILTMAGGLIVTRARLHSDVLDMLPRGFESVGVYKTYDREFSQARELLFGLLDETGKVDLDAFAEHVAAGLRQEVWVHRVMERSPVDAPGGLEELRAVALPLILNQAPADFQRTLSALKPEAITARLAQLRGKIEAGVGFSTAELEHDPLGIIFPAMQGLRTSKPMASSDHSLRLIVIHTRQADLGEAACKAIMQQVEDFRARTIAAWQAGGNGEAPQILCTGRTAYVAEMTAKMKSDIASTVASSVLLVAITFYIGFRRWRPLLAMVEALLLCCILAVAAGALLYAELNMITVGLCAILVGLGVDFSMVLYAFHRHATEEGAGRDGAVIAANCAHGRGVMLGAVTTAAAFLCLLASESPGFEQLGVLIACGILIAAGVMLSYFWLFLRLMLPGFVKKSLFAMLVLALGWGLVKFVASSAIWSPLVWQNISIAVLLAIGTGGVAALLLRSVAQAPEWMFRSPLKIALPSGLGLFALGIFAAAPVGRIQFDLDPKSLEPHNSVAGYALRTIMSRLNPGGVESVMAVIRGKDAEDFSRQWQAAHAAWNQLVERGTLHSVATPAALALSPIHMAENARKFASLDLVATRKALDAALDVHGFAPENFVSTKALLDAMTQAAAGKMDAVAWRNNLPESSAWWFVIDAFLSRDGLLGVARIKPPRTLADAAEAAALREALAVPGVNFSLAGWSYSLTELGPWSSRKMVQLSALMIGVNIALLLLLLRDVRPVIIITIGLTLAVGALFAILKVTGLTLNLFNILAFPLVLGVGVDYGIYFALALRSPDARAELGALMRPVLLSGLTTVVGFGSLAWAQNPALSGLGMLCALGVGWCLFTTFFFMLPAFALSTKPPSTTDQKDIPSDAGGALNPYT